MYLSKPQARRRVLSLEEALLLFIIFWLALALLLSVVRVKGVQFKPFILIVKASPKRLDKLLARLLSGRLRALAVLLDVGVAVGFGMMAFSLYFLAFNLVKHFTSPKSFVAVLPPIPGVLFPLEVLPHFIAALFIAATLHEVAHAAASKHAGIKVRSVGAALLAVIIAAFVELEEKDVEKAGLEEKLRVFSAGSFANLALFILLLMAFTALFQPGGVFIQHVEPSTPASSAGIVEGCVIQRLNDTYILSVADLHGFMERTRPNQTVMVGFLNPDGLQREVSLSAASHPANSSRGFLGVMPVDFYEVRGLSLPPRLLVQVLTFYGWLEAVLFSLAVFNMLPMAVTDGGRMIHAVLCRLIKDGEATARKLVAALTVASVGLIAFNIAATLAL